MIATKSQSLSHQLYLLSEKGLVSSRDV